MPTSLSSQSAQALKFIQQFWSQAVQTAERLPELDHRSVILCGCGDSHHASYTLSYAFQSWAGARASGLHAMEASQYVIPRSTPEALLVVGISASGETARTLEAVRLARELGARTLAITAQIDSSLAGLADGTFPLELPSVPEGPGLISYLGALLAGYAIALQTAPSNVRGQVESALNAFPGRFRDWSAGQVALGEQTADHIEPALPITFLGSGPVRGAAMFAAAKVIESAGQTASDQDVEEWAHLEYFNEPPDLPIWLLSAGGRSAKREQEVLSAAQQIGRTVVVSEWDDGPDALREVLSPLALWAGPIAYADGLMKRLGQSPFRSFGGGRSRVEGGGASRIRSSEQIRSLKEIDRFDPQN